MGISYNYGVVLCEQYPGAINGEKMAEIVYSSFNNAFDQSSDPKGRRFLQDGCPRQNSKAARVAFEYVNATVFKIPSRTPDLNPIEKFFHMGNNKLRQQALDDRIQKRTFLGFSARVRKTMIEYPVEEIDKIIEAMDKRIEMVLKAKGMRR